MLVERVRGHLHRDRAARRRRACAASSRCRSGASGVVRSNGDGVAVDAHAGGADHAGRRPAARKIASSRYVVVVLPFVPVTPTSGHRGCRDARTARRPSDPIASRTEPTTSCGTATASGVRPRGRGAGGDRVGREVVAVRTAPGMQKKSEPGGDVARSRTTRRDTRVGGRRARSAPTVGGDVGEPHLGEGRVHRARAYTPPAGLREPGSRCGGSATGALGSIPRRWIAYRATCWNSGAAATPP